MTKTWIGTIHSEYDCLEDLKSFSDIFSISERLGFDNLEDLWNENPIIGGSTNPKDYGIAYSEEIAETMISSYKEAIEFTEEYDGIFPEPKYSEEAEQKILEDISKFLCKINNPLLKKLIEGIGSEFEGNFAHDLWLSRNGHGSGFFDGEYLGHEDELQDLAKEMGESDVYIGDDGLIYLS